VSSFHVSSSNGIACFGPSLFVSAAFVLSLTATSLCNFLELDDTNVLKGANVAEIGFWCYERSNGDRYGYSNELDDNMDSKFEAARSMGLIANILGFFVWIIYLLAACIPMPAVVFVGTGFVCLFTCMFEGTLTIFIL
jgi:hypothetical protein